MALSKLAVTVDHHGGEFEIFAEGNRAERMDPCGGAGEGRHESKAEAGTQPAEQSMLGACSAPRFGASTSKAAHWEHNPRN